MFACILNVHHISIYLKWKKFGILKTTWVIVVISIMSNEMVKSSTCECEKKQDNIIKRPKWSWKIIFKANDDTLTKDME